MNLKRKNKEALIEMITDLQARTESVEETSLAYEEVLKLVIERMEAYSKLDMYFKEQYGHTPESFSIWKMLFSKSYRDAIRTLHSEADSTASLHSFIQAVIDANRLTLDPEENEASE
jgi:hypothetical protein